MAIDPLSSRKRHERRRFKSFTHACGPIQYLLFKDDSRFMAVAPLCPPYSGWNSRELNQFLIKFTETYPIDKTRVYLTGISMGGHGTWSFATDFPQNFAAIAPLCGAGKPEKAKMRLKHLPVWIIHLRQGQRRSCASRIGNDPGAKISRWQCEILDLSGPRTWRNRRSLRSIRTVRIGFFPINAYDQLVISKNEIL